MKNNKVLLIYSSEIQSTFGSASLRVAPIGLFFINGLLRSKGYDTKIMHFKVADFNKPTADSKLYLDKLRKEIELFNPDYIGYSFRNLFHWGAFPSDPRKLINYLSMSLEKATVDFLRKVTSAPIIAGGPAFTLEPKLYMDYLKLDYGFIGEGELVFEELIAKLAIKQEVNTIPGLVYRENNSIIINPARHIDHLDKMPKMEIGEMAEYRQLYYDDCGYANVQTKRGCAFKCIYCQYPYLEGNRYRLRNIKTVIEEIIAIKNKFQIRHFFIVDGVFNTPVKHSLEFCDELIKQNLDIEWCAYVNPRGMTKEVIKKYKESGCHNLVLTPDTLSAKTLKSYGKDFTIEEIRECVQALKEVGIPFEVSLILGGPGENEETVNETVEFCDKYLKDIPVHFFDGMWLHPQAPVMTIAKSEGVLSDAESADFAQIVLSNDFDTNSKWTYFFPHIKSNRKEFLSRIYANIRKYKRIVAGKDMSIDWSTATVKHAPELGVIDKARPWHEGMKGRTIER